MSFTLDWTNEGLRVGGYPDGSDWIVVPTGGVVRAAGLVGPSATAKRAWVVTGPRNGYGGERHVVLFNLAKRRRLSSLAFESLDTDTLLASRDGRRVYAISSRAENELAIGAAQDLHTNVVVINAVTGAIADRYPIDGARAWLYRQPVVETTDERIRLPVITGALDGGRFRRAIATLDPRTGAVSLAALPEGGAYLWLSPTGRYALRPNLASLPVRDKARLSLAGIGIGRKVRYYGLGLQLWRVNPARYVRTIAVAWLTGEELPDDGRAEAKWAAYDAIRAACDRAGPDAHGPPPLTASPYPEADAQREVASLHWQFAEYPSAIVWSDDERSFWVKIHGFWTWASVEGAVSPRIRLERTGMAPGMVVPFAHGPHRVEPLDERRARFVFRSWRGDAANGTALVRARPSSAIGAIRIWPRSRDHWASLDFDPGAVVDRIAAELRTLQVADIPLAGLSPRHCLDAIAKLDGSLSQALANTVTRGSVTFSFVTARRPISEEAFFGHVETNVPQAAPALRALVERLVAWRDLPGEAQDLPFSEEWQLLGPAVKALGVLDASALPLVGAYGRMLDLDHEVYFLQTTLPAIIQAHGWTAPVIDLALAMMLLEGAPTLWFQGLGTAAAAHLSPEVFAAQIAGLLAHAPHDEPGPYGHPVFAHIRRETGALTGWEEHVFTALEQRFQPEPAAS